MVEFAMVGLLLVLLVVGIINFGLVLSFKQDVTRAASEGARVGAVALHSGPAPATQADDQRFLAAQNGTDDAVDGFDEECGVGGLTCTINIHDCDGPVPDLDGYWDNGVDDCVTVELDFDYANFPKFPAPPILGSALPDTVSSSSVARLNL